MKANLKGNAEADLGYAVLVPDPKFLKWGWFRASIGACVFAGLCVEGLFEAGRYCGASGLPDRIYIILGSVAFILVCLWTTRRYWRHYYIARSTREVIFVGPPGLGVKNFILSESGPLLLSKTCSGKYWAVRSSRGKR